MHSTPPLDRKRIADLFDGDVVEMKAFLLPAAAKLRERCELLLAVRERAALDELVHEVRGAALNVGASGLAAALHEVELQLRRAAPADAAVSAVLDACDAFTQAVQHLGSESEKR